MLRSMGHFLPRRCPHKCNDLLITQKMELETGNALGCKNGMLQYNTLGGVVPDCMQMVCLCFLCTQFLLSVSTHSITRTVSSTRLPQISKITFNCLGIFDFSGSCLTGVKRKFHLVRSDILPDGTTHTFVAMSCNTHHG